MHQAPRPPAISCPSPPGPCRLQMARLHPGCALLLRIRADDPSARCQLGNKYGAEPADAPRLLAAARELGLAVCGVSFHVGSGAKNPLAFRDALEAARRVFDLGTAAGFDMRVLDIGGGFCGGELGSVPATVNEALDRLFPEDGERGAWDAVLCCLRRGAVQRGAVRLRLPPYAAYHRSPVANAPCATHSPAPTCSWALCTPCHQIGLPHLPPPARPCRQAARHRRAGPLLC